MHTATCPVDDDTLEMSDLDRYHHDMLFAADRIAWAVRTEDPATIAAEITDALRTPVPVGGPDPVYAVITALAVQIDPERDPLRKRVAWTLDIAAINAPPRLAPSSAGYYGSAGYGGTDREQHRHVPQARPESTRGLVA